MAVKNYFQILGIADGASPEDARKAYHKLAREHHPDRFTDAAEKSKAETMFAEMTEAFTVLTDLEKRSAWEEIRRTQSGSETAAQREAKTYFKGGVAKMNAGSYDEAVRLLKGAVHLDSEPGTYHAHLAKALEKTGAFGDASRSWEEAIKREPFNGKYFRFAGECMEQAGMKIRARKMFEKAVQLSPADKTIGKSIERLDDASKKGFLANLLSKFKE